MSTHQPDRRSSVPVLVFGLLAFFSAQGLQAQVKQTNLVSDIPGLAKFTDPDLANPWGIAFSPTSPFWIADNHTGLSTLYNGSGVKIPLVVTIPAPGGGVSAPTGQIFNGGTAFNGDRFIFSSEDGTITGWRGALGTTAETLFPGSAGSVYKGLAIGTTAAGTYLYASDFHNNKIDVFPSSGAPSLSGSFHDGSIPAGFAPFNIQNIGGQLFVTYAKQDADAGDDVAGAGNGFVDKFDLNGNLLARFASNGVLNSPWGLAVAPAGFGKLGGDLLIGNFGDGKINAFDPTSGAFIGDLENSFGGAIVNEGLWGLTFGNGGVGGKTDTLYFTAGIPGDGSVEDHGLLGSLSPVPEPSITGISAGIFLAGLSVARWRRRQKNNRAQGAVANPPIDHLKHPQC